MFSLLVLNYVGYYTAPQITDNIVLRQIQNKNKHIWSEVNVYHDHDTRDMCAPLYD